MDEPELHLGDDVVIPDLATQDNTRVSGCNVFRSGNDLNLGGALSLHPES
ncbi:MAG: hypothetical protein OXD01_03695 [Gammaproteobacteria bacterium]|nr:hypothetical protein [Gammaproteobacteria bacterium]